MTFKSPLKTESLSIHFSDGVALAIHIQVKLKADISTLRCCRPFAMSSISDFRDFQFSQFFKDNVWSDFELITDIDLPKVLPLPAKLGRNRRALVLKFSQWVRYNSNSLFIHMDSAEYLVELQSKKIFLLTSGFSDPHSQQRTVSFRELCFDKPEIIELIDKEQITDLAVFTPNCGSYLKNEVPVSAPYDYELDR